MSKQVENGVAKQEQRELSVVETPAWMGTKLSVDRKVPRLLLMQGTSQFVTEEKAKAGDIVRSTTGEKVGGKGLPVKLIILSYPKHERIIEVKLPGKKKFDFVKVEPRTAKNQDDKWFYWADEDGNEVAEGTKGALEAKRVRLGSFFALLPGDLDKFAAELEKAKKGEMPDLSVEMTPVQVRFRSYSYEASLKVEDMLQKIAAFGREPWEFVLEVKVGEMKNDDNAWFVFEFEPRQSGKPTPDKYKETAKSAFRFIQENSDKLVIDEKEEQDGAANETTADAKGQF